MLGTGNTYYTLLTTSQDKLSNLVQRVPQMPHRAPQRRHIDTRNNTRASAFTETPCGIAGGSAEHVRQDENFVCPGVAKSDGPKRCGIVQRMIGLYITHADRRRRLGIDVRRDRL